MGKVQDLGLSIGYDKGSTDTTKTVARFFPKGLARVEMIEARLAQILSLNPKPDYLASADRQSIVYGLGAEHSQALVIRILTA